MNYLQHPNTLVHFWSSLNTEFDKILDTFVSGKGWLFQDLGIVAKNANIGDIHRCACTLVNLHHGKADRLDHFLRVNFVILDCAKTQWLAPWRNYVIDPSKGVIPPFLKRQVGGFFLLYMLYLQQPPANRFQRKQRIVMHSRDLIAMHVFNATMQRLPKSDAQFKELAKQLVIIFNDLVKSDAFEFSVVNDSFVTPCHSVRQLLASKLCFFTKMIYTLKDVRDQLYYITHNEASKVSQSLLTYGKHLPQRTENSRKTRSKENPAGPDNASTSEADKKWSVEEIKELENENDLGKIINGVTSILNSLDFGPVLTRKRMTGIQESFLDREIDNVVKNYEAQRKHQEVSIAETRQRREALQPPCNPRLRYVLKGYFSGNHEWIGKVFRGEECVPDSDQRVHDVKVNSSSNDNCTMLHEVQQEVGDDFDDLPEHEDQWITDSDAEEEETEFKAPPPKKPNTRTSPHKRGKYRSMPILCNETTKK